MKEELKIYITRHKRNIDEIVNNIKKHNIDYCIVDDTPNHIRNENTISLDKPTGKNNFYLKYNLIYDDFMKSKYNYIIIMPDDFINFDIDRIINEYKEPVVMKIIRDSRTKCWINKEQEFYNETHFREYFVDCTFMTTKDIYKKFGYITKTKPTNTSSGVGKYHSTLINKNNIKILSPIISYAEHNDHESVMHKEERLLNPLISTRKHNRRVVVSMATFNNRDYTKTIKSILNQSIIPEIYIYNNETNIDYNSNAKFFITKELTDEILITIDDDIIYPYNYIETIINYLEINPWVTMHGRKWHSNKINSYKVADKNYVFSRDEEYEGFIDVGGTGVSGFDLSKIDVTNLFDYITKEDRMDDVMVSCYMYKQNIKPYHIKHKVMSAIYNDITCYNTTTKFDKKHIEYVNEIIKK